MQPYFLPWQHHERLNNGNNSSSSSGNGSVGETDVAGQHTMPARVIHSINSADDDSILDMSTSGSIYSYNSTGQGSVNALQLPQNSGFSDAVSHVSVGSEVGSDQVSELSRNV